MSVIYLDAFLYVSGEPGPQGRAFINISGMTQTEIDKVLDELRSALPGAVISIHYCNHPDKCEMVLIDKGGKL